MAITDSVHHNLRAAMNVRWTRQELLATNVANADTPGYTPRDLEFEGVLRQAMGPAPMARTTARHLDASGQTPAPAPGALGGPGLSADLGRVAMDDVVMRADVDDTLDDNGVDMDREMARAADNAMQYRATLEVMRRRLGIVRMAIADMNR